MAELDIFMQKYIHLVSTRCDCDKNVLTILYQELLKEQEPTTCTYKFLRGDNKGTFCGDVIFENTLCKKHAKQLATKEKIQGKKTLSKNIESKNDVIFNECVNEMNEENMNENEMNEKKMNEKKMKEMNEKEMKEMNEKEMKEMNENEMNEKEMKEMNEKEMKEMNEKEMTKEMKEMNEKESIKPIVIHFDSKLNENIMHVNKSPIEITREYEKIIPKTIVNTMKKKRVLPPSLRPVLKIGDKIVYNDGKKSCKATIKKIIKDMAQLDNIYDSSNNDIKSFYGSMRYIMHSS